MQWRHVVTITVMAALFLLGASYVLANNEDSQATKGAVAEPAPSHEDEARFEQLAAVLNQSKTGRDLLSLRKAYKVVVRFETGLGSSFMQAANRIRLEAILDPVSAALVFTHEMNHALAFHEGRKAHRQSESRQEYINQMLREESEGMAVSIQVKKELEANGIDVTETSLALENEYHQAYQAAIDQVKMSTPSPRAHQLSAIGKAAGLQALFDAHLRGETRTANTHEPCVRYYGRLWDDAHPILAFVSGLAD